MIQLIFNILILNLITSIVRNVSFVNAFNSINDRFENKNELHYNVPDPGLN